MKRKKLIIEIPDWAEGRKITILAGIECLAIYSPVESSEYVKIKENRCIQCGKCCRWKHGIPIPYFDPEGTGICDHLVKEVGNNDRWICKIARNRPYSCSSDPPEHYEGCSITHRLDYSTIEEIDE